ncbi:DUF6520 family protein [Imtechella halotolerans]|uniref:Secreted protein n=1 Tax=Imtechella halotolerans K1 TaxID=946077 RepID=I0W5L4_9FLAO|nr:DUF6520 family protein [Imtechella halotolerans]EID71680.1 hypothetical protein W5A_13295 [Imtechella halotolerans K1]WMQ64014.1 DUF6520 family protein [Imtechella halotolerans]
MKKLKMILPMLAFVLAIGMSFAFVKTSAEKDYYATKYIQVPGGWATITVDCDPKNDECLVKFSNDPLETEFRVYDLKNLEMPSIGNGEIIELSGSIPTPDID